MAIIEGMKLPIFQLHLWQCFYVQEFEDNKHGECSCWVTMETQYKFKPHLTQWTLDKRRNPNSTELHLRESNFISVLWNLLFPLWMAMPIKEDAHLKKSIAPLHNARRKKYYGSNKYGCKALCFDCAIFMSIKKLGGRSEGSQYVQSPWVKQFHVQYHLYGFEWLSTVY